MSNPVPFHNIHSTTIRIEATHNEVYAAEVETGFRIRCCPKCWEPYNVLHEDFDGTKFGCVNYRCSEYRPEKIALMRETPVPGWQK